MFLIVVRRGLRPDEAYERKRDAMDTDAGIINIFKRSLLQIIVHQ